MYSDVDNRYYMGICRSFAANESLRYFKKWIFLSAWCLVYTFCSCWMYWKFLQCYIITVRKRSLGQGNVFTGICLYCPGLSDRDPPGQRPPHTQRPAPQWTETPPWTKIPLLDRHPSLTETFPRTVKSGRYASYLSAFLFFLSANKPSQSLFLFIKDIPCTLFSI